MKESFRDSYVLYRTDAIGTDERYIKVALTYIVREIVLVSVLGVETFPKKQKTKWEFLIAVTLKAKVQPQLKQPRGALVSVLMHFSVKTIFFHVVLNQIQRCEYDKESSVLFSHGSSARLLLSQVESGVLSHLSRSCHKGPHLFIQNLVGHDSTK